MPMILRLLKLVVSLGVYLFDRTMGLLCRLGPPTTECGSVVLCYHGIRAESLQRFAAQLDAVLHLAEPVCIQNLGKAASGKNMVALTFDDGLATFRDIALPQLTKRGIPVAVFIPTGYVGSAPAWAQYRDSLDTSEQVMTGQQLRDISRNGLVTIGSHCVSHSNLTLLDESQAEYEIGESKRYLEELLNQKVSDLSFPYGAYYSKHIAIAQQAGYRRVFSGQTDVYPVHRNAFIAGRVSVGPNDWSIEFRLKVLGAYRWIRIASNIKKLIGFKPFRYSSFWNQLCPPSLHSASVQDTGHEPDTKSPL
jgi:peptidoglycan/xylan/chitin deacetylase (PgdA/CDA1 family)